MNLQVGNDPLIVADIAPNPYFGPTSPTEHKEIPVIRTLRNDPLGQLRARRQVDPVQYEAGRRWQADNELAGPKLKSSGHLEEPVDGGGHQPRGIVDRQIDAHKRLLRYATLLGPRQTYLLVLVLDQRHSIWGATTKLFPDEITPPKRRFVGQWLREILSILAKDMGLAS